MDEQSQKPQGRPHRVEDFEASTAPEQSDLVFKDKDGHWTTLLAEGARKQAAAWLSAPPTYYIIVESTNFTRETAFPTSRYQARLVRQAFREPGERMDILISYAS